jgi:hypothetical protein
MANDMSISIISTSSLQWCAQILHFIWWNTVYPAKQVGTTQIVELIRINPYNTTFHVLVDDLRLESINVNNTQAPYLRIQKLPKFP